MSNNFLTIPLNEVIDSLNAASNEVDGLGVENSETVKAEVSKKAASSTEDNIKVFDANGNDKESGKAFETAVTDNDAKVPTSGAVFDYVNANSGLMPGGVTDNIVTVGADDKPQDSGKSFQTVLSSDDAKIPTGAAVSTAIADSPIISGGVENNIVTIDAAEKPQDSDKSFQDILSSDSSKVPTGAAVSTAIANSPIIPGGVENNLVTIDAAGKPKDSNSTVNDFVPIAGGTFGNSFIFTDPLTATSGYKVFGGVTAIDGSGNFKASDGKTVIEPSGKVIIGFNGLRQYGSDDVIIDGSKNGIFESLTGNAVTSTVIDASTKLPTSNAVFDAIAAIPSTPLDTVPADDPTSAISSQWAYGMQGDRSGWREQITSTAQVTQGTPGSGTWYNLGGHSITFGAAGEVWDVGYYATIRGDGSNVTQILADLSTTSAAIGADKIFWSPINVTNTAQTILFCNAHKENRVVLTGAKTLYLNLQLTGTSLTNLKLRGDLGQTFIYAQRVK